MPRIIVFTGKGGTGKTSVAAATAVRCAARGLRTVVISTDIAHSLGDAFDRELRPDPVEVAPNLWAHESDVQHELARSWGTVQAYIESVFKWRGIDDILAEEMSVLPGMDEIAGLLRIAEHHDRHRRPDGRLRGTAGAHPRRLALAQPRSTRTGNDPAQWRGRCARGGG